MLLHKRIWHINVFYTTSLENNTRSITKQKAMYFIMFYISYFHEILWPILAL